MEINSKSLGQILAGLRQEAQKNTGTDTYDSETPFSLIDILKEAAQSPEE